MVSQEITFKSAKMRRLFNQWRYGPLLKQMSIEIEDLHIKSKIKAAEMNMADRCGNKETQERLNIELTAEKVLFYAMTKRIASFCYSHKVDDPFVV